MVWEGIPHNSTLDPLGVGFGVLEFWGCGNRSRKVLNPELPEPSRSP